MTKIPIFALIGCPLTSCPITSWHIDGETVKIVTDYFGGAPISLQMVTVGMKLKDAYSFEEKL